METVRRLFDEYFQHWSIMLPPESLAARLPGIITKAGWTIRYVFGKENDGREFLEFYAVHRMTDDRHEKIYADGTTVELDAIVSMYCYNPEVPGDQERSARENRERNQRIYRELQEKGLDVMTINTYLSLGEAEKE